MNLNAHKGYIMVGSIPSSPPTLTPKIKEAHRQLAALNQNKKCLWQYILSGTLFDEIKVPVIKTVYSKGQRWNSFEHVRINTCIALYIFPKLQEGALPFRANNEALRILLLHSRDEISKEIDKLDPSQKMKLVKTATRLKYIYLKELEEQTQLKYHFSPLPADWQEAEAFASCVTYGDILKLLMEKKSLKLQMSFLDAIIKDENWNPNQREKIILLMSTKYPFSYFNRLQFLIPMYNKDFFIQEISKDQKYEQVFMFVMENRIHTCMKENYLKLVAIEMELRTLQISVADSRKEKIKMKNRACTSIERILNEDKVRNTPFEGPFQDYAIKFAIAKVSYDPI